MAAGILYFMDLSGQCGYSLEQQLSLFRNIRPLFLGTPLLTLRLTIAVWKAGVLWLPTLSSWWSVFPKYL